VRSSEDVKNQDFSHLLSDKLPLYPNIMLLPKETGSQRIYLASSQIKRETIDQFKIKQILAFEDQKYPGLQVT
jgi:hypothetical protein